MNENLISAKEDAKQNLNNIQDWIKAADTKFSILLGVVAVLFGLTTVIFKSLPYIANNEFSATVFFVALFTVLYILSTVTTLLICLIGLFSRLKPNQDSCLYFGCIANKNLSVFKQSILSQTEEEKLDDLLNQIHINSIIANKKMKLFNYAIVSAIILLVSTMLSLIMLYGVLQ